jgi:transcriptional regulator with XRE-family HTH domain
MMEETLALRVQKLRESLYLTPRGLAQKALLSEDTVQDIESGLQLFLSPATRSRLARALRVRPEKLAEVERPFQPPQYPDWTTEQRIDFLQRLLEHPTQSHACPSCGHGPLLVQTFERRDLNNQPITAVKVRCSRCFFKLEHD